MPDTFQNFIKDPPGWETVSADLQFANDYLRVYILTVRTPSRRQPVRWTLAHRKAAAIIAPMTPDGRLLLVRQERIPIRDTIWEFPAGQIDDPTAQDADAIRAVACRELREETGYMLPPEGEWLPMGSYYSSPGFTDEHGFIFLARGVVPSPGGASHDEAEMIHEVRAFEPTELRRMIAANEIRDANTLSAFARLTAMGLLT